MSGHRCIYTTKTLLFKETVLKKQMCTQNVDYCYNSCCELSLVGVKFALLDCSFKVLLVQIHLPAAVCSHLIGCSPPL